MLRQYFPQIKNILVDTNLFLVLIIGQVRHTLFGSSPVSDYSRDDYNLIRGIVSEFDTIVTTPYLLSEVSSRITLTGNYHRGECRAALATYITSLQNEYTEPQILAQNIYFPEFGISDISIFNTSTSETLVLTDDGELIGLLKSKCLVLSLKELRETISGLN